MTGRGIPYFRFYPADFMNGVRGLSAQEVGVYTMLLCRIYEENGPVEYHPRRLATYCGMRENVFVKIVEKLVDLGKITLADGVIGNRRASLEMESRANDLKNSSKAGKASAEKRQQKQQADATGVEQPFNHTDTDKIRDTVDTDVSTAADAPEVDLTKAMFDQGVKLMAASGTPQAKARSLLGKWRRDHGEEAVIVALGRAQREGAIDPVGFVEGALRFRQTQGARASPAIGERRTLQSGMVQEWAGASEGWQEVRC